MNPLKDFFNKVFVTTPPADSPAAPKEEAVFEWNPDEAVAPTSARAVSWKRGDSVDDGPRRVEGEPTDADIVAAGQNLPAPQFERGPAKPSVAAAPRPETPVVPRVDAPAPPPPPRPAMPEAVPPPIPAMAVPVAESPSPAAAQASAQPLVPLSDFEDVYRKAGIKSPVHGYGVERVYRLLTSRRLVGLDRSVRRSALLTALDAAGVPASDVSQDAVLRRKALTAYEAEKALELQSLRSRNESRAEALQDTVETFTRQKQSQIERLAQGSTSAVRAQSDLEIRKRMEQDRLYRSLAYFVEPLPSPTAEPRPAFSEAPRSVQRFDATIEMGTPVPEEAPAASVDVETLSPSVAVVAPKELEVVTITPQEESGATKPIAQSGLEMALRAAAQDARAAGWGQTAIVPDSAPDTVEALRKLREAGKTESES